MAAVEREREVVLRRQAQVRQLQVYVQRRLREIEVGDLLMQPLVRVALEDSRMPMP